MAICRFFQQGYCKYGGTTIQHPLHQNHRQCTPPFSSIPASMLIAPSVLRYPYRYCYFPPVESCTDTETLNFRLLPL